eukprot:6198886-Prymnesium_polylepis.1
MLDGSVATEETRTREVVLRYIYRGENLRNGRVLRLRTADGAGAASALTGAEVLLALDDVDRTNVDLTRWAAFYYSHGLEGWERLRPESCVVPAVANSDGKALDVPRVELRLEALQPVRPQQVGLLAEPADALIQRLAATAIAAVPSASEASAADGSSAADGYFGIGVYNSKSSENVGTLWRSAFMLGSAFIFTIGSRNAWEKSADTYKAWRSVPAFRYENWDAFCAAAPYTCQVRGHHPRATLRLAVRPLLLIASLGFKCAVGGRRDGRRAVEHL